MPDRPVSDIEVANLALSIVDEPGIGSFAETDRKAAREARKWYGPALERTLSDGDWNFASAWTRPARDPAESQGILKNRFPLPPDCVRVRDVFEGDPGEGARLGASAWQIENARVTLGGAEVQAKVLVTNAAAPTVRYTRYETNVALWDMDFVLAMAHRYAAYLAPAFGKSTARTADLRETAEEEGDRARREDAKEGAPKTVSRDTSWIRARRGGRG